MNRQTLNHLRDHLSAWGAGIFCGLAGALLLALPSEWGFGAPKPSSGGELSYRSKIEEVAAPLTTEGVWSADPDEPNPHRQRWALERKVELVALRPVPEKKKQFGVTADALESLTRIHVRGPGPWYQPLSAFSCEPEPDLYFATREGAERAAEHAAESWDKLLAARKARLGALLDRISTDDAEKSMQLARQLMRAWKDEVESEWRVKSRMQARMAEWRKYVELGTQAGICKPGGRRADKSVPEKISWEKMLEPTGPAHQGKLLVRAPARRWNGMFSVRMTVDAGGVTLNGQFLVDSGAGSSMISPDWLRSQGLNPVLLEIAGAPLQRVSWTGGSGLARKIQVEGTSMAGVALPLREFLLMDTLLFTPPENLATCCDGILGADFLRQFAVEFIPGQPSAVQLWERAGFTRDAKAPWVEVALTPQGEPVSNCSAQAGESSTRIQGVRWDTGSEMALDIHVPHQKEARQSASAQKDFAGWRLQCGDSLIATQIPVSYPNPEEHQAGSPLQAKVPGFNVGMELLARGPFTFDLPHGKLWFDPAALKLPFPKNESGLVLQYVSDPETEDRLLKISRIRPSGAAVTALAQAGIKVGMRVTQVDGTPIEDLDQWQVDQKLAGLGGPRITLRVRMKGGDKIVPVPVK